MEKEIINMTTMRIERNEQICKEWQEVAADAVRAGESPSAVLTRLAAKWGMTPQSIANVLKTAGIYESAKDMKEQLKAECHE